MVRGLLVVCVLAAPVRADNPPITDRNYAIDLYDGVAIGDTEMVGMGGAGAALINGTAGALINPSAIAVRQTTDLDHWNWTYHFDYLTGRFSSDYDNNGVVAAEGSGAQLITGGFGLRFGNWSGAVTLTQQSAPIPGTGLSGNATRTRLLLGNYEPLVSIAVGIGLQIASFSLQDTGKLFEVNGANLIGGATWLPPFQNFRVGGSIDLAIAGGDVKTSNCDPMNCRGFILPNTVEAPWRLLGGVAYRIGPTEWNQPINNKWREEEALTLAADIVLTGSTANGYGLEAFGMQELQRSGRHIAFSIRGGAEYEWLPGRLRVRAGSYWEPSRFEGVGGRIHGTAGAELALFDFHLFGLRRLQTSFTGDIATRYRNIGISIGFWH